LRPFETKQNCSITDGNSSVSVVFVVNKILLVVMRNARSMSSVHDSNAFTVRGFTLLTYYSEVSLKTFLAGSQLVFRGISELNIFLRTTFH